MIPVRCQSIKSVIYTRTTKIPEISTISGILLYLLISRNCILGVYKKRRVCVGIMAFKTGVSSKAGCVMTPDRTAGARPRRRYTR